MAVPYAKPFKAIPDQIALLNSRGMIISDIPKASKCLERIGYYRLSGYAYPYRQRRVEKDAHGMNQTVVLDEFQDGTNLGEIIELYVFDKKLRIIVLDAIERMEVALRVDIALLLGARSPTAHRETEHVHGNFARITPGKTASNHENWIKRLDEVADKSKEEFVKHFNRAYHPPLPIWVSIETWDFGLLSVFISGMRWDDLLALCAKYEIPRPQLLQSWIRSLNHVRNICAHHRRFWNRTMVDNPARPTHTEMPLHSHWAMDERASTRVYSSVAILRHFMRTLHPNSHWTEKLKLHIGTFPNSENPNISLRSAGFSPNWGTLPLWN